jgi:hypothetical protein
MSSDLPGVNPATLNGVLLYYGLMTKWSGLGDSTELSRVGLSDPSTGYLRQLGGCSGGSLGLRCQAFNGHRLGDGTSLGFGPCQQKTFGLVSHGGYDYSLRTTAFMQCTHLLQCWPPAA